jgi:hypothetical protein
VNAFDEAVVALYRAPHGDFVATRKRLAAALAADGDATGAARLSRLERPPVSAWVVNQLWYALRPTFETLIDTAARLRAGDSSAGPGQQNAMAKLRAHAAAILAGSGHTASDDTLNRVAMTLAALAATGGFSPDPDGALSGDRDPPSSGDITVTVRANRAPTVDDHDEPIPPPRRVMPPTKPPPLPPRIANGRVHVHVEPANAFEDDVQTSIVTETSLLEAALATARQTIAASERERDLLMRRLAEVEQAITQARTIVEDVVARLKR